MTQKKLLLLTLVAFMAALLVSSANARAVSAALSVNVNIYPRAIVPTESVSITCTSNMNGIGIVFVVQPQQASSVASSQSEEVQTDLNKISLDPDASLWKTICYAIVIFSNTGGGQHVFTFPEEFKGLNGEPSTDKPGKYFAFFVFLHLHCIKIGFDCANFFVVPEVPLGTLMASTAFLGAFLGYFAVKRFRIRSIL